jgi:hypothetical protein
LDGDDKRKSPPSLRLTTYALSAWVVGDGGRGGRFGRSLRRASGSMRKCSVVQPGKATQSARRVARSLSSRL